MIVIHIWSGNCGPETINLNDVSDFADDALLDLYYLQIDVLMDVKKWVDANKDHVLSNTVPSLPSVEQLTVFDQLL